MTIKVISFAVSDILKKVRLMSAYEADRNPDLLSRWNDVLMVQNDSDLAGEYLLEAVRWLEAGCKRYISAAVINGDNLNVSVQLSGNSISGAESKATGLIESALAYKTLDSWLRIVANVMAERVNQTALGYLQELGEVLNMRVRPSTTSYPVVQGSYADYGGEYKAGARYNTLADLKADTTTTYQVGDYFIFKTEACRIDTLNEEDTHASGYIKEDAINTEYCTIITDISIIGNSGVAGYFYRNAYKDVLYVITSGSEHVGEVYLNGKKYSGE